MPGRDYASPASFARPGRPRRQPYPPHRSIPGPQCRSCARLTRQRRESKPDCDEGRLGGDVRALASSCLPSRLSWSISAPCSHGNRARRVAVVSQQESSPPFTPFKETTKVKRKPRTERRPAVYGSGLGGAAATRWVASYMRAGSERNLAATTTAQWVYSSVSSASLQKTGVFLDSVGDFREFSAQR